MVGQGGRAFDRWNVPLHWILYVHALGREGGREGRHAHTHHTFIYVPRPRCCPSLPTPTGGPRDEGRKEGEEGKLAQSKQSVKVEHA